MGNLCTNFLLCLQNSWNQRWKNQHKEQKNELLTLYWTCASKEKINCITPIFMTPLYWIYEDGTLKDPSVPFKLPKGDIIRRKLLLQGLRRCLENREKSSRDHILVHFEHETAFSSPLPNHPTDFYLFTFNRRRQFFPPWILKGTGLWK